MAKQIPERCRVTHSCMTAHRQIGKALSNKKEMPLWFKAPESEWLTREQAGVFLSSILSEGDLKHVWLEDMGKSQTVGVRVDDGKRSLLFVRSRRNDAKEKTMTTFKVPLEEIKGHFEQTPHFSGCYELSHMKGADDERLFLHPHVHSMMHRMVDLCGLDLLNLKNTCAGVCRHTHVQEVEVVMLAPMPRAMEHAFVLFGHLLTHDSHPDIKPTPATEEEMTFLDGVASEDAELEDSNRDWRRWSYAHRDCHPFTTCWGVKDAHIAAPAKTPAKEHSSSDSDDDDGGGLGFGVVGKRGREEAEPEPKRDQKPPAKKPKQHEDEEVGEVCEVGEEEDDSENNTESEEDAESEEEGEAGRQVEEYEEHDVEGDEEPSPSHTPETEEAVAFERGKSVDRLGVSEAWRKTEVDALKGWIERSVVLKDSDRERMLLCARGLEDASSASMLFGAMATALRTATRLADDQEASCSRGTVTMPCERAKDMREAARRAHEVLDEALPNMLKIHRDAQQLVNSVCEMKTHSKVALHAMHDFIALPASTMEAAAEAE